MILLYLMILILNDTYNIVFSYSVLQLEPKFITYIQEVKWLYVAR